MAELADALDLGSSSNGVGVQVLFPAPSISTQVSLCVFLYHFFKKTFKDIVKKSEVIIFR